MAHIRCKRLEFVNLLSYGAKPVIFNFEDGLNLIKGSNGKGKSAIIEALTFVFFGKAYRDVPKASLINTYNGKGTNVKLYFDRITTTKTEEYMIERGMRPNRFNIFRDGVPIKEEGKAGVYQSYLESAILGFNESLYRNVIAMSSTFSTPLLEMKTAEKRKYLEAMLGVSDIERVKKEFNSELSDLNSSFKVMSATLPIETQRLEELEGILENAKKEAVSNINELKNVLSQIEKSYNSSVVDCTSIKDKLDDVISRGKEARSIYSEYETVEKDLSASMATMKAIKSNIEIRSNELSECVAQLNELDGYTSEELDTLLSKLEKYRSEFSLYNNIKNEIGRLEVKIELLNTEIITLQKSYKEAKSGIPCGLCGKLSTDEDVAPIREKIAINGKEKRKELTRYEETLIELKSKECKYDELSSKIEELTRNISLYEKMLYKKQELNNNIERLNNSIIEYNTNKSELENNILFLRGKVDTARELYNQLENIRVEHTEVNSSYVSACTIRDSFKSRIDELSNEIRLKENSTSSEIIQSTETSINNTIGKINSIKQNIREASEEIEILKYIINVFGDDGIKEYMMKKYIPVLNNSIRHILIQFGIPFRIEFDKNMDFEFINTFGAANEYKSLSGGQKARLHFSVYVAFREFVNKIGKFSINLLFLDEILDTAIDEDGLDDMIEIISSKVSLIGCVYLISHRTSDYSQQFFDKTYEVCHDGKFSYIKNNK